MECFDARHGIIIISDFSLFFFSLGLDYNCFERDRCFYFYVIKSMEKATFGCKIFKNLKVSSLWIFLTIFCKIKWVYGCFRILTLKNRCIYPTKLIKKGWSHFQQKSWFFPDSPNWFFGGNYENRQITKLLIDLVVVKSPPNASYLSTRFLSNLNN